MHVRPVETIAELRVGVGRVAVQLAGRERHLVRGRPAQAHAGDRSRRGSVWHINSTHFDCPLYSRRYFQEDVELIKGQPELPIDWTLRTKVRFLSPNPFPWSQKIKTCEEASATTG